MTIRLFYVLLLGCLLPLPGRAQPYQNRLANRQMFWSEQNLVWKTSGRWSFQLDHQYRRMAADVGTRDLNIFRYPMQQVFRPWVAYQLNKGTRLSLSPIGLWWTWARTTDFQPTTFTQEIRIIPQLQLTRPLGDGELIYRFRSELRWPSALDTLTSAYIFLSDGESTRVLADNFNIRLRAMTRWINPIFKRSPDDRRWYTHVSVEPMAVLASADDVIRFDQNRTYLALGREIRKGLRVELGYLNQFSIRRNTDRQLRTFQFNNALHVYLYLENFWKQSKSQGESGPD